MPGVVTRWSFGGKVAYAKVSAGGWPPVGLAPASAGIGLIGGQTPAETLVYATFPPKLHRFTTPDTIPIGPVDICSTPPYQILAKGSGVLCDAAAEGKD